MNKDEGGRLRAIVETCLRRELQRGAALPSGDEDVVECGALDSMAWVSVVRAIEQATEIDDFGDRMMDRPRSIVAMMKTLEEPPAQQKRAVQDAKSASMAGAATTVAGWGSATGTQRVAAAELERAFKLPRGKISKAAGIESVARVGKGEDEVTLAVAACDAVFGSGRAGIGDIDCLIATSETHVGFPSLGARIHAALLADERCAVLDVGGACLGVVNALAVAHALLAARQFRQTLIVSADVHSRALTPARVKGEFGALFGDGASAFLLRADADNVRGQYRAGAVTLGCNPAAASAIRVGLTDDHGIHLTFEGDALSRAAIVKLEELIEDLELRTGLDRKTAAAFATHQPNPRLLDLLARQLGVSAEKFPPVAKVYGNLGSSTCGVALSLALEKMAALPADQRGPIFVAALGPGMLWGGTVLTCAEQDGLKRADD